MGKRYCDECSHRWSDPDCGQCPKCGYANPSRDWLVERVATLQAKHERLRDAAMNATEAYWHSDSADTEIDVLRQALRDDGGKP